MSHLHQETQRIQEGKTETEDSQRGTQETKENPRDLKRQPEEELKRQPEEVKRQPEEVKRQHEEADTLTTQVALTYTRQGIPTNGHWKLRPRKIQHWADFKSHQNLILGALVKPNPNWQHQLDFIEDLHGLGRRQRVFKVLGPFLRWEDLLINISHSDMVQPISRVINGIIKDSIVQDLLDIVGSIEFKTRESLGSAQDLSRRLSQLLIDRNTGHKKGGNQANKTSPDFTEQPIREHFCIHQLQDHTHGSTRKRIVLVVEYKCAESLTLNHIMAGLVPLDVDELVIKQTEEDVVRRCKRLVAAIITEAFSSMVLSGLENGVVFTGEAFIFLHVAPEDPTTVYYWLSVLKDDDNVVPTGTCLSPKPNSENRLQLTSFVQFLAFTLWSLQLPIQSEAKREMVMEQLDVWNISLEELERQVPKSDVTSFEYQPRSKRDDELFISLPTSLQLQPVNQQHDEEGNEPAEEEDKDVGATGNDAMDTTAPEDGAKVNGTTEDGRKDEESAKDEKKDNEPFNKDSKINGPTEDDSNAIGPPEEDTRVTESAEQDKKCNGNDCEAPRQPSLQGQKNGTREDAQTAETETETHIPTPAEASSTTKLPFCSPACLKGLKSGGPLDLSCPNAALHGDANHEIAPVTFRELVCNILREKPELCWEYGLWGHRGCLYVIQVMPWGYTMMAKGTNSKYLSFSENEAAVYQHLEPIQGQHIPVYMGTFELPWPRVYMGLIPINRLMLLSYGGVSLDYSPEIERIDCGALAGLRAIHGLGVLHGSVFDRNLLYHKQQNSFLWNDFERATIYPMHPSDDTSDLFRGEFRGAKIIVKEYSKLDETRPC